MVVVVVVDVGVVVVVVEFVGVVVVVVVVEVLVPAGGVLEGPVPATASVAVGVEFAPGAGGAPAMNTAAEACPVPPFETSPAPPDCAPAGAAGADPVTGSAGRPGTVVVVVLTGGTTGPDAWAESTDWAMGPAPMLSPATTDRAAAATAPAATRRLRTK